MPRGGRRRHFSVASFGGDGADSVSMLSGESVAAVTTVLAMDEPRVLGGTSIDWLLCGNTLFFLGSLGYVFLGTYCWWFSSDYATECNIVNIISALNYVIDSLCYFVAWRLGELERRIAEDNPSMVFVARPNDITSIYEEPAAEQTISAAHGAPHDAASDAHARGSAVDVQPLLNAPAVGSIQQFPAPAERLSAITAAQSGVADAALGASADAKAPLLDGFSRAGRPRSDSRATIVTVTWGTTRITSAAAPAAPFAASASAAAGRGACRRYWAATKTRLLQTMLCIGRRVDWDFWGHLIFLLASCLYMANAMLVWYDDGDDIEYFVMDKIAAQLFIFDSLVYICGWLLDRHEARTTVLRKSLFVCSMHQLDWNGHGDLLFLLGSVLYVAQGWQCPYYSAQSDLCNTINLSASALFVIGTWPQAPASRTVSERLHCGVPFGTPCCRFGAPSAYAARRVAQMRSSTIWHNTRIARTLSTIRHRSCWRTSMAIPSVTAVCRTIVRIRSRRTASPSCRGARIGTACRVPCRCRCPAAALPPRLTVAASAVRR